MRVVSYVRVSSQEQTEGYSLEAQRIAIRLSCQASGDEIVEETADEGISATFDQLEKRPGFARAVAAIEAGEADAIMVHKFDRAARQMLLFLQVMQRIGGRIISVTQHANYATPEGAFFVRMLASMAQFYSDNLGQEVKKGKEQRKREGWYSGRLPFGLVKQAGDEHARMPPIPDTCPILCTVADRRVWSRFDILHHIFELAAEGRSLPRISQDLHAIGYPLALDTIYQTLVNRFYIGELPVRGKKKLSTEWLPGNQGVFIDPDLFRRANEMRERKRNGPYVLSHKAKIYPLSGLARCNRCGAPLYFRTARGRERYVCGGRSAHQCNLPGAELAPLEAQCMEYVRLYTPPEDLAEDIVNRIKQDRKDTRRERASLEDRKRRLRDLYRLGDMSLEEYVTEKAALERQMILLQPAEEPSSTKRLLRWMQNWPEGYEAADGEDRNALLRELFSRVIVDDGRIIKAEFQPPFERIFSAFVEDASDRTRRGGNLYYGVRAADGLWLIPPLGLTQASRTRIPRQFWPEVRDQHESGVPAHVLADKWRVSEATIYRTVRRAREA